MTTPTETPRDWTVDDPRMWKEQCRVGDVAFQHLFCTSKGKPLPDWVKEGLPNLYQLLSINAALTAQLKEARRVLQEHMDRMERRYIEAELQGTPIREHNRESIYHRTKAALATTQQKEGK